MVAFQYVFRAAELAAWKRLLIKAFPELKLIISTDSGGVADIAGERVFAHLERCCPEVLTNPETLITVRTENIWDEAIFWELAPRIEFGNAQPRPPSSPEMAKAIEALVELSNVDPRREGIRRARVAVPFDQLGELLVGTNARAPLKSAYLSPSEPHLMLMFKNYRRIAVSPSEVTNVARCVFDFDDGAVEGGSIGIREDFVNWKKAKNLDAPIFTDRVTPLIAAYAAVPAHAAAVTATVQGHPQ
jgi:hypothetical protein